MPETPPETVPNYAKQKLEAGALVLCMGIRLGRTADIARLAKACRDHGRHFAIGGIRGNPELLRKILDMGARFILGGGDWAVLLGALRANVRELRELRVG